MIPILDTFLSKIWMFLAAAGGAAAFIFYLMFASKSKQADKQKQVADQAIATNQRNKVSIEKKAESAIAKAKTEIEVDNIKKKYEKKIQVINNNIEKQTEKKKKIDFGEFE